MRSSREHRPTLLWSPHSSDLFALGTSDKLSLFEFQRSPSAGDAADFDGLGSIDSSNLDFIGLESLAPPRAPQTLRPVSAVTDVSQLTCATWSPRPEQPWTLAVGTATGKLVLHDCSPSAPRAAAATSVVREFFPCQQRVCFSIAWNPVFTQLIAAGLDRDRRDYGVLVWDVERDTSSFAAASSGTASTAAGGRGNAGPRGRSDGSLSNSISAGGAAAGRRATEHRAGDAESAQCYGYDVTATVLAEAVSSAHAYAPLANSEAAVAVSWLPESPHSLLVGTSFRWLRLFDVRARDEQLACHAHAKAVYGVVFDPFNPNRLLTFSDASDTPAGVVKGWDLRRLSQGTPLFTLAAGDAGNDRQSGGGSAASRTSVSRGLLQVGWAPTQRGLVGTMAEGATGLCVWDVDQMILVQQHQQQGDYLQQPDLPAPHAGVPPAPPPASPAHAPSAVPYSHGAPPPLRLPAQLTPRQQQQQQLGRQPRLAAATGVSLRPCSRLGSADTSEAQRSLLEASVLELHESDAPHCLRIYDCDAPLGTFSWHPTQHARLLVLLRKGAQDTVLRQIRLSRPAPIAWSPSGELLVATPKRLMVFSAGPHRPPPVAIASAPAIEEPPGLPDVIARQAPLGRAAWRGRPLGVRRAEEEAPPSDDAVRASAGREAVIAETFAADVLDAMRWRARADYGLDTGAALGLLRNGASATSPADQRGLLDAWRWVHMASGLQPSTEAVRGHVDILGAGIAPSSLVACSFSSMRVRESAARSTILRTCGWSVWREAEAIEDGIASLEAACQFERAALASVFHAGAHASHHGLERAVLALERGGTHPAVGAERATVLRMTAMVVAGFAPSSTLWASTVPSTAARLRSPHLRLLLAALCCSCVTEQPAPTTGAAGAHRSAAADVSANHRSSCGTDSATDATALAPQCQLLYKVMLERLGVASVGHGVGSGAREPSGQPREPATQVDGKQEELLLLSDAVAVACRFLDDQQLQACLRKLNARAVSAGALAGLSFCGLTEAALPLLQAYIDRTCDVQTAAALLLSAPPNVMSTPQASGWMRQYREQLNQWQLYHARCRLDAALGRTRRETSGAGTPGAVSVLAGGPQPPSLVFARCAFCNSSLQTGGVARSTQAKGRCTAGNAPPQAQGRVTAGIAPPQAPGGSIGKATACPSCKKALPRCALCLQHLGCPNPAELPELSSVGILPAALAEADFTPSPSSAFSHWMVWCQTCRHGGHAQHLEEWFELHDVCPVADCECRCSLLDAIMVDLGDGGLA